MMPLKGFPLEVKTPPGFEAMKITIPVRARRHVIVEALVHGEIAVYRNIDGLKNWTVSHKRTGHAALKDVPFQTAISYARKLNKLDWSSVKFNPKEWALIGLTNEKKKEIAKILLPVRPELAKTAAAAVRPRRC